MLHIYNASAGSGKTFTLAREYLRMLLRDTQPHDDQRLPHSRILAVTFTKNFHAGFPPGLFAHSGIDFAGLQADMFGNGQSHLFEVADRRTLENFQLDLIFIHRQLIL